MPGRGPVVATPTSLRIPGLPDWVSLALANAAILPVTSAIGAGESAAAPVLKAGGKALSDRLGEILASTAEGTGLPSRLRLTSYDPVSKLVHFHGVDGAEPFEATATQLDRLLRGGQLAPEPGPYDGLSLQQMIGRLLRMVPTRPVPK